jgi:hypothetical protein
MNKITWMPVFTEKVSYDPNITYYEPEPAFKYLASVRGNPEYLKCPALSAFLKNTFVIKSPYDLKLNIDIATQNITSNKFGQDFFNEYVDITPATHIKDHLTIQTFPKYLFISNSKIPIIVSVMPWFFKANNFSVIPGAFDITKWIRPVHLALEMNDQTQLEFNRGEPLYCVKFETEDTVILERGNFTEDLKVAMTSCLNTKNYVQGMNLKTLYNISTEYIQMTKRKFFRNQ